MVIHNQLQVSTASDNSTLHNKQSGHARLDTGKKTNTQASIQGNMVQLPIVKIVFINITKRKSLKVIPEKVDIHMCEIFTYTCLLMCTDVSPF